MPDNESQTTVWMTTAIVMMIICVSNVVENYKNLKEFLTEKMPSAIQNHVIVRMQYHKILFCNETNNVKFEIAMNIMYAGVLHCGLLHPLHFYQLLFLYCLLVYTHSFMNMQAHTYQHSHSLAQMLHPTHICIFKSSEIASFAFITTSW
jgi:hypothetical protein